MVTNKTKEVKFKLYIDVAYVESLKKPIVYIEYIEWGEDIKEEYGFEKFLSPTDYLKSRLTDSQLEELMKEQYFAMGKHMTLWNLDETK